MPRQQAQLVMILVGAVFLAASGVFAAYGGAIAQQPLSPPRPPITPIPRPTPAGEDEIQSPSRGSAIASIALETKPAPRLLWSVVQWKDAQGAWHDVEGWRGAVANGRIEWAVEEKDFGTGPFRWLVYDSEGDYVLEASEVFQLPDRSGGRVVVSLLLTRGLEATVRQRFHGHNGACPFCAQR